ncbi:MAG: YceD family protein [Methylophilaceae bacterium]
MMKPTLINNLEFAQKQETISGEIAVKNCDRLAETLTCSSQNVTNIRYTLTGQAKKLYLPSLHLTIDTTLPVLCQRCLEQMSMHLSLKFDYLISTTEPDGFDHNDEIDWLEVSSTMNLSELIEDELLVAMPIAPVHEETCTSSHSQSGENPNPFAVLKGIVGKPSR